MTLYSFSQIAANITVRVEPADTDLERYVGLEHLDPESLKLRRWGSPSDVIGQKLKFWKGDIIYGKRRAYQRKLAVADFDGICSAHAMVLRAKPEVCLPEFLPFFLQSDLFHNRALEISVGSLSPTINWTTLAKQEFPLPPVDEQRRIADLLWAADDACDKLQVLLSKSEILKKKVFEGILTGELKNQLLDSDEVASNGSKVDVNDLPKLRKGWSWKRADEVCDFITKGATPSKKNIFQGSGEVPFIKVYNLTFDGSLDFSIDPTFISQTAHTKELNRSKVFPGDVLMNIVGPPLGKVSIVPDTFPEWNINQAIVYYRPLGNYDANFLAQYLLQDFTQQWFYSRSKKTSGQRNLTLEMCRDLPLPIPPESAKAVITETTKSLEDTVNAVKKDLDNTKKLKMTLLNQLLK